MERALQHHSLKRSGNLVPLMKRMLNGHLRRWYWLTARSAGAAVRSSCWQQEVQLTQCAPQHHSQQRQRIPVILAQCALQHHSNFHRPKVDPPPYEEVFSEEPLAIAIPSWSQRCYEALEPR